MSAQVSGTPRSTGRFVAVLACALITLAFVLCGCDFALDGGGSSDSSAASSSSSTSSSSKVQTFTPSGGSATVTIKIASGSENKEAAEAIQHAVDASGVAVEIHYMGSLDIMGVLKDGGDDYDAVWPASSIWISLGDTSHLVKDAESTSTTPVVFGVSKAKAIELGWADSSGATKQVSTSDIIAAVQNGQLTFSMTSATQSNSGASAYLAFLSALSGESGPLTADDLQNEEVTSQVKELLSGVDRSSGSSDWLKDMVVSDPENHQAMVNYESLVIQANKELEAKGADPLLAIYPSDGIAISDSPLGYVDRGQGSTVKDAFDSFQSALEDDEAKLLLERVGRRCGLGGKLANPDDEEVSRAFRSDWGITTDASVLKSVPMPAADVITQALQLYQSDLRKPSYTIWVVDYSGSMYGEGKDGVVEGLTEALDPERSAASMIQPGEQDVNVLVPFSSSVHDICTVTGTDTSELLDLARSTSADGGTFLYPALEQALELATQAEQSGTYTVAIVAMTDGMSTYDEKDEFEDSYRNSGTTVPIFSIMFGDADSSQLDELAELSNGKVFDGREGDLADVFRQVKGYN